MRQEPASSTAGLGNPANGRPEPHFEGHAVDPADAIDLPVPLAERRSGLDPLIDAYIAPIVAEQQVQDAVLAAMPLTRRAGSKLFAIGASARPPVRKRPSRASAYLHFLRRVQLAKSPGRA